MHDYFIWWMFFSFGNILFSSFVFITSSLFFGGHSFTHSTNVAIKYPLCAMYCHFVPEIIAKKHCPHWTDESNIGPSIQPLIFLIYFSYSPSSHLLGSTYWKTSMALSCISFTSLFLILVVLFFISSCSFLFSDCFFIIVSCFCFLSFSEEINSMSVLFFFFSILFSTWSLFTLNSFHGLFIWVSSCWWLSLNMWWSLLMCSCLRAKP